MVPAVALAFIVGLAPAAHAQEGLIVGTVLPDTGALADYGAATQAAVALAVGDANAAGGVAGVPVELVAGDSGDSPTRLAETAERLRSEGAQVVIGPLSSSLLLGGIEHLDGMTVVSPATTSPLLSGLVARVAPSDALEGAALATLAAQARVSRLAIVAPRDAALIAQRARDTALAQGVPSQVITYAPRSGASAIADQVARVHADGLILITGAETTSLIRELLRRGLPGTVVMTAVAGANIDATALPRGTLRGARVLGPDLRVPRGLADRIRAVAPQAKVISYSALAYDAAAVAILAAEQSARFLGTVTAAGIRAAIPSVTTGGSPCSAVATCLRAVRAGSDIDYVGQSGAVDLGEDGDPVVATYSIRTFGPTNVPGPRMRYVTVR